MKPALSLLILARRAYATTLAVLFFAISPARAEPPVASYIFPAGGQRGAEVPMRVGGLFLHRSCGFEIFGPGLDCTKKLKTMPTLWFEGPLLPLPDSQRQEDYPKDMSGKVQIAADAPLGMRFWRLTTSQGCTPTMKFMVGDLPEVVENEIEGDPVAVDVRLPVTINGRIFPRADVDLWRFSAKKGESITCEVHAARLGSPLEANLQVLDAQGKRLAESDPLPGGDCRLRFVAPRDGPYQIRICDIGFQGSQAHVYRLTITADAYVDWVYPLGGKRGTKTEFAVSGQALPEKISVVLPAEGVWTWQQFDHAGKKSNPILLDLDEFEEHQETLGQPSLVALPAMCNGRVAKPGGHGEWRVSLKKGETLVGELRAARLGSPLDGVVTIADADGKELARADQPLPETGDPSLQFTATFDSVYTVRVQDRFRTRGGPSYAYRLRLSKGIGVDFRLRVLTSALNVPRGGKVELPVTAERIGGHKDPITLIVDGLPKNVTAKIVDIGAGASGKIVFEADKEAAIQPFSVVVKGTAKSGGATLTRLASGPMVYGQPTIDAIAVAVAVPTPFKIKGEYDMRWAARGSVHERLYQIERNGFDGPLEIALADRQARHLQGVYAKPHVVPAGATEFRYAIQLPPWMETGRTSRTCVMAVGIIRDKDGTEHEVSFSSVNQNEQMVAVVEPGKLDLIAEKTSFALDAGARIEIPFRVARAKGLEGAVTVELVVPIHVKGLVSEQATLKKDEKTGRLVLRCDKGLSATMNLPLLLRATLLENGRPVIAETTVEVLVR